MSTTLLMGRSPQARKRAAIHAGDGPMRKPLITRTV